MHYGLPPIGTYLKPTFIGYLGKKITSLMSFMMEACLVVKIFVILYFLLEYRRIQDSNDWLLRCVSIIVQSR